MKDIVGVVFFWLVVVANSQLLLYVLVLGGMGPESLEPSMMFYLQFNPDWLLEASKLPIGPSKPSMS